MTKNQERIIDIDVAAEMRESFLEYSYSVIYSRALPDARDGLKPVQRRIIYQMGEMGLRPDRGHVKSARVTGEVMGKLHPHGDGAIYDALVRMSQSFSLRLPLIDGHGNFGSLDDGPAAARYTEARLASAAMLLNESLDEDVVDFEPNYDAQLTEPSVLPAAFPNLLVNGASGIAVGMATNMAPHNLGEVVAALRALLKKDLSTEELMKYVPGPDLPSGGIVISSDSLVEAYETGRGSFKMRARVAIDTVAPRRLGLVITELPYQVGPERVVEKIRDAVNSKKLTGIHNVVDLTDRENGLRLIVELKTGFDPESVLEALYKLTPLEENFSINNVALVNGRPEQLSLKDLMRVYLEHRIQVVKRRSKNRLDRRRARLHLIDGLRIAVLNIDEVIELIRKSETAESAKARLMKVFDLSELQAEHILELRLRRLTKFSTMELEKEGEELRKEISELEQLLANENLIKTLVGKELQEVSDKYSDPRRSEIVDASGIAVQAKVIEVAELKDAPVTVMISPNLRIYRANGHKLAVPPGYKAIETTTRSDVGFILSNGKAIRVHVANLPPEPEGRSTKKSPEARKFLGVSENVIALSDWNKKTVYAIGTKQGVVKRIEGPLPDKEQTLIIGLKDNDEVIGFAEADEKSELAFVTAAANLLVFPAKSVRPQGLPASGMAGINLPAGPAIYFGVAQKDAVLISAANSSQSLGDTDPGSVKCTALKSYPRKGRGSMGVRCQKFLKGEDQLYFASVTSGSPIAFDSDDKQIELPAVDDRRDGSGTKSGSYLWAAS
jgi:DNA gyrase subunit A